MKKVLFSLSVVLATILFQFIGECSALEETSGTTAFIHINLIPMTGKQKQVVKDQTVLISDNRITASGPYDRVVIPSSAKIIDGGGAYLMPGLADMHMHLRTHWISGDWPVDPFLLYLANGVTTVRCFGPSADGADRALKWKKEIHSGNRIGPQIFTCGRVLDGPVENPEHQVKEQHALGFDFIKIYSYVTRKEFKRIMTAAKQTGMYTAGHIPFQVGLDSVIKDGMDEIAHVEELIWEFADLKLNHSLIGKEWMNDMIQKGFQNFRNILEDPARDQFNNLKPSMAAIAAGLKQADIPVCTTLYLDELIIKKLLHPKAFLSRMENKYLPRSYVTSFKKQREKHQIQFKGNEHLCEMKYAADALMLKELKKAGVDILLSTDAGTGGMGLVPGVSIHDEIKTLVKNGFTPYEAIAAGTVTASKIIGRMTGLNDFGTIQAGKRADLLLVEANPLEDPANLKKIKGVMAAGNYYDRNALKEMLSIKIPVKAAIHSVHEPESGLWTYLDVIIGKRFSGHPEHDIDSITVNGPDGPLPIGKQDFRYISGIRDYWLKIPGPPQPGTYEIIVKGMGLEGRAFDVQTLPRTIPLMNHTQMQPAGLVRAPGIKFSWQAVPADTPYYYQLEIRHAFGKPVYKSPVIQNMLSHTIANDILNPGQTYTWRVRVTDSKDFIKTRNRTQSTWRSLTMADKLEYHYTPPVQTKDGWQTSTLDNEGVAPGPITDLIQAVTDKKFKNVDSIILIKNGKLILEEYFNGYHRRKPHLLASVTKSITSMLLGLAVDKKMIPHTDIPVYQYFPEYKGTPWIDQPYDISLKHALTMTAGLQWDETTYSYGNPKNSLRLYYDSLEPVAALLRPKKMYPSGSRWNYNSGLTVLLGEIIRKASGLYPDKFAQKYLFGPLGIKNYRWLKHPDGPVSTHGDLFMTPRDMAKIGQVMLDKGQWQGRRIISEQWVKESTRSFIDTRRGYGYGYQWRRGTMTVHGQAVEGYWASGMGGQKIYIFMDLNMVAVFTSKVYNNDFGHDLNASFLANYIIPAVIGPAADKKPPTLSAEKIKAVEGHYRITTDTARPENAMNMIIQVRFKNNKLTALTPFGNIELFPVSDNRFYGYMDGVGKFHINFVTDKHGKVTRLCREIGFRRMYFEKFR